MYAHQDSRDSDWDVCLSLIGWLIDITKGEQSIPLCLTDADGRYFQVLDWDQVQLSHFMQSVNFEVTLTLL